MGKMKDVLIEIEELTEQNEDLIERNTALHKTVYDLKGTSGDGARRSEGRL